MSNRSSPISSIIRRTKEDLSEIVASDGRQGLESMSMKGLLFIGPYLYRGLEREFGPNLTVKKFARVASRLTTKTLQSKMQNALQNYMSNRCTRDGYQVRYVNERGYLAVKTLLVFLSSRGWIQMRDPPSSLPPPNVVNKTVKYAACTPESQCTGRGVEFVNGMCQPRSRTAVGFEGIGEESGQRSNRRNRGYVQSSHPNVFWLKPRGIRSP